MIIKKIYGIVKPMQMIKTISRFYKGFAVIILNTILLFIFLNIFFYFVIQIRGDSITNQKFYNDDILSEVYPHRSHEDINLLLKETKSLFHVYKPYVQFTEPEFRGKFVNINRNGFREGHNQCRYPINKSKFNVFVFGGSTTLGYGVADNETIPSQLQDILLNACTDVCVYNFGQGAYFSTQERIFFENLLVEKQIPNIAVFIDGLNDFYTVNNDPLHTKRLAQYMARRSDFSDIYSYLPLFRAINYFLPGKETETGLREDSIEDAFSRLIDNKKIIEAAASEFNVKTYFVIQPVPTYKYNLSYHIPYSRHDYVNGFGQNARSGDGYALLSNYYNNLNENEKKNLLWLADMQENQTKNLYIDIVHYNTEFNGEIAGSMANSIAEACSKNA